MKRIGIHIRLNNSLTDLVHKAYRLGVPFFQCLLVRQDTRRFINPTATDIQQFKDACAQYRFTTLILHASYYFNLCNPYKTPTILDYELSLARQLGFTHIVLHPGTMVASVSREESIQTLAHILDSVIERYPEYTIVLENTAIHHANAVGSNIEDFKMLLSYMTHGDKIRFCIDTAHAYVYGYDIATIQGQEDFIATIDATIRLDRLGLVHLNNSYKGKGSGVDHHAPWFTGLIPPHMLARFMNHPLIKHVPVVLELPSMSEPEEATTLADVYAYEKGEKQ